MKNFIKGMLFISLILPIISNFTAILDQFAEWVRIKIAVASAQEQAKVNPEDIGITNAIGFTIPSEEPEDYEEEE